MRLSRAWAVLAVASAIWGSNALEETQEHDIIKSILKQKLADMDNGIENRVLGQVDDAMEAEINDRSSTDVTTKPRRNPYSPKFKPLKSRMCPKPLGSRSEQDRYCEANYLPLEACGCKEVCHIWGDPHVSPFFSACSTTSMSKPKVYTFFELPANASDPDRIPIKVTGKVEKIMNRFKFVTELYVDYAGEVEGGSGPSSFDGAQPLITAKDCDNNLNEYLRYAFPLLDTPEESVILYLTAVCETKHANHLNVTLTITDNVKSIDTESINTLLDLAQSTQIEPQRMSSEMPDSTSRFPDDFGVCTDPRKYGDSSRKGYGKNPFWMHGDKCKRPTSYGDGRDCACGAQCSAFGDPHVHPFSSKHKAGGGFKADITKAEFRVMYSVFPTYSGVISVNECGFTTGYFAVYLKDVLPDPENLYNPDNYRVNEYVAADLCSADSDTASLTRKVIHAPQPVAQSNTDILANDEAVYSQSYSGYQVGKFLVYDDGTSQVIPRNMEDNIATFIQHTKASSESSAEVASVVDFGGVQAILKCHGTEVSKRFPTSRPYFNICIEHGNINADAPPVDDSSESRISRLTPRASSPVTASMLAIEKVLETGGWCATGAAKNKSKKRFDNRKASDIKIVPYNPEVERAQAYLEARAIPRK